MISGVNLRKYIYLWPSGRVDNLPLNIKTWKLHKFKIWGWWRLKVNYIFWDRLWSLQLILLKGLFQQSSHLSLGKVFNYTELPLLTHTLCRPSWDTVRAHEDVQTSFFMINDHWSCPCQKVFVVVVVLVFLTTATYVWHIWIIKVWLKFQPSTLVKKKFEVVKIWWITKGELKSHLSEEFVSLRLSCQEQIPCKWWHFLMLHSFQAISLELCK